MAKRARVAPFDGAIINQMLTHALRTAQLNAPQLWDARQALEYRIVELAALRRTAQDVAELQGLVEAMQLAVNDPATMTELDIRFHTTLARISGNPLFPALITALA
ncbi:FadR/GntR family transcriptional regulator [Paludibacterium denitrificans]|nr:FCD domain-containing protein [Paludibacterium denitrificans]